MRELQGKNLYDSENCKKYIGNAFRSKLAAFCPIWMTNEDVCDFLFE